MLEYGNFYDRDYYSGELESSRTTIKNLNKELGRLKTEKKQLDSVIDSQKKYWKSLVLILKIRMSFSKENKEYPKWLWVYLLQLLY